MRYFVTFIYWMVAVLLLALILVSFDYRFGRALFFASALLPGMLCAKLFLPMAMRAERRRMLAVVCVVTAILMIEWLALLLAGIYTSEGLFREVMPPLFSNPIFILVLLTAFVVPEELMFRYLKHKIPADKTVAFISERRKVTLQIAAILFVESNDKEVLLHTPNACYRTRTGISQWERMLDDRFVRIHRAYLVNVAHVVEASPVQVTVGEHRLDVSRKYRETVLARFPNCLQPAGIKQSKAGYNQDIF